MFERIESRRVLDSQLLSQPDNFFLSLLLFPIVSLSFIPWNLFHRFLLPLFPSSKNNLLLLLLLFNRSTLVERYSRLVSRNEEKSATSELLRKTENREQKETFDEDERERLCFRFEFFPTERCGFRYGSSFQNVPMLMSAPR